MSNMKYRWNEEKGVEGTIEVLWTGMKLVSEETHFNHIVKEMVRLRMTNSFGDEVISETEKKVFEDLIRDGYIISFETGKPVEYIKKHKI